MAAAWRKRGGSGQTRGVIEWIEYGDILVFPAASRPSISSRISLDPKILPIIFDIDPPILFVRHCIRSSLVKLKLFSLQCAKNVSQRRW